MVRPLMYNDALRVIVIFKVSVIKAKVTDELGMPTGKQKLQIGVSNSAGVFDMSISFISHFLPNCIDVYNYN